MRQTIRRALVVLFTDFVNFGQSQLSTVIEFGCVHGWVRLVSHVAVA